MPFSKGADRCPLLAAHKDFDVRHLSSLVVEWKVQGEGQGAEGKGTVLPRKGHGQPARCSELSLHRSWLVSAGVPLADSSLHFSLQQHGTLFECIIYSNFVIGGEVSAKAYRKF